LSYTRKKMHTIFEMECKFNYFLYRNKSAPDFYFRSGFILGYLV